MIDAQLNFWKPADNAFLRENLLAWRCTQSDHLSHSVGRPPHNSAEAQAPQQTTMSMTAPTITRGLYHGPLEAGVRGGREIPTAYLHAGRPMD